MAKILVVGGAGMLGRPVVVQLINDGFDVRLFTTDAERAKLYFRDRVEYAEGDVGSVENLKRAIDGCDGIYVNLKGGPTEDEYIVVEMEGSENIYEAAIDVGVNRVVQISEARADVNHAYFIPARVKAVAEEALAVSGLTYTVLKPTWFFESLPLFIRDNKAIYIGSGKTSFHLLAAADYARIASLCFQSNAAENKILTIFGPEAMPIPEALRRFLAICYPDTTIDHLPIWLAKLSTLFVRNQTLKTGVKMMAFFDRHGDDEVAIPPDEADSIFGRSKTTIEEWAKIYRQIVKGV